jgi:hypothetical protein
LLMRSILHQLHVSRPLRGLGWKYRSFPSDKSLGYSHSSANSD